MYNTYEIRWW